MGNPLDSSCNDGRFPRHRKGASPPASTAQANAELILYRKARMLEFLTAEAERCITCLYRKPCAASAPNECSSECAYPSACTHLHRPTEKFALLQAQIADCIVASRRPSVFALTLLVLP